MEFLWFTFSFTELDAMLDVVIAEFKVREFAKSEFPPYILNIDLGLIYESILSDVLSQ